MTFIEACYLASALLMLVTLGLMLDTLRIMRRTRKLQEARERRNRDSGGILDS